MFLRRGYSLNKINQSLRNKGIDSKFIKQSIDKIKEDELTAKSFDKLKEFKTNLEFKSLPYEINLFEKDSTLELKRNRWHKNLAKD